MASSPFFESKQDENRSIDSMLHQQSSSVATTAPKKKRNQPGTPYPDAEVVALSPKTLMATNRFICEVCNKGFQREQNLQLHRRGHNLPWKLKQKSNKEVRRKVYLCPEPSCIHHHAARALGDLTGIKKHYFRKHGEKKWKCDKCSKRYAVQSDWKAHSKTCGTREYRCDCGTLFSRRDSFITHRAFCDALAQESARLPSNMSHHLYGTNHMSLGLSQMQDRPSTTSATNMLGNFSHQSTSFMVAAQDPNQQGFHDQEHGSFPNNKSLQGLMQLPNLQGASANTSNLFNNLGFFSNNDNGNMNPSKNVDSTNGSAGFLSSDQFSNDGAIGGQGSTMMFSSDDIGDHVGSNLSSLYVHHENVSPHMSATALLQKAAQMGSTTSSSSHNPSSLLRSAKSERQIQMENENHLQGIMNSLANRNVPSMFGGTLQPQNHDFGGFSANRMGMGLQQHDRSSSSSNNNNNASFSDERIRQSMIGSDKLTLDFLGVGGMVRNMGVGGMSQKELQLGINMSSINPADHLKPASFGSSKLQ